MTVTGPTFSTPRARGETKTLILPQVGGTFQKSES